MTFFDDYGRELESQSTRVTDLSNVHDVDDIADRGRQPDFTKESLIGKRITVIGISGPEDFPLGAVYFVLIKLPEDKPKDEPWGIMFPAKSPVVTTTLRAARQKMLPFVGILDRTTSESNPDYQYWNWRRK